MLVNRIHRRLDSRRYRFMAWIITLIVFQSCSDSVSIDDRSSRSASDPDAVRQIESESDFAVLEDGRVTASGPVEGISPSSIGLAGVDFGVTPNTALYDAAGEAMMLSDVMVGTFFQVEGQDAGDGSYVASLLRADSTVILCHIPPGHPDDARSLRVGWRSADRHLSHGDYEGECAEGVSFEEGDGGDQVETGQGDDENEPEGNESDGDKVLICHIPPGNPDHSRTIGVDPEDVQDHLDHGDYEGECEEGISPEDGDQVENGEGDGENEPEVDGPEGDKVLICHIPPGNPDHSRTIGVDPEDVQDHLDHGDYEGECEGG